LKSDYPYTSGAGVTGTCKYNSALGKVSTATTAYANVTTAAYATIAEIQSAVAIKPNSVSIEASTSYFQSYKSGIMQGTACGTSLDHAVVIVGYGTSSTGMAYWTVRNSWGTGWGESGYFQVEQTEGLGVCGINQDVAYPFTNNA
jgi:C1A family cysteine protease